MTGFRKALLLALASGALAALPAAAQQTGAIVGKVTDRSSGNPIADASVVIVGTTRGSRSNEQGQYRISGLAAGTYSVRVIRLGYLAATRPVTVGDGEATADFQLAEAAVTIDEVVVSATGATERKRENGNDVGIIKPGQNVSLAAEPNLTSALAAKTPGLTITQGMGTAGSSSRIRIRGANSVSLSNEPLLIVDGVRVDNSTNSMGANIFTGGATISRFDDINPDDVESIEVLKGPAASALYGTAAANGVIQITTKRGRSGKTAWRSFVQYGNQWDPTSYPSNYFNVGTKPDNTTYGPSCTMDRAFQGLCSQGTLAAFNPADFYNVFTTGNIKTYGVSVSGGSEQTQYFVSGDVDRQQGAVTINHTHNTSLRANLTAHFSPKLNATFTSNYVDRDVRLPDNDNDIYGPLGNILLGHAFNCAPETNPLPAQCNGDTLSRGFYSAMPSTFYIRDQHQYAKRFVGGATANWQPLSWLTGVGQAGVDLNNLYEIGYWPSNVVTWVNQSLIDGNMTEYRRQLPNYSTQGSFTATHTFLNDLATSTSLGAQYINEQSHYTYATVRQLIPGTRSLQTGSAGKDVGENNQTIITVGGYFREQFGWKDRAFLTASLRADENSAFGKDFKLAYYPAVSASWVISEEPFLRDMKWVSNGILSQLRLRSSFGQSGQRPGFRQADTYYSGVSIVQGPVELPALVVGGTGNPELKPEISTEYEAGFDANFFDNRLGVVYTHYSKTTRDALIARVLAPSLGVSSSQYVNLGRVYNAGNEFSINGTPVDMRNARFDVTVTGSTLTNRLQELGKGIAPIVFATQRHVEGYPLGGYWTVPILSYNDADKNGVLTRDEVNIGTSNVYRGPSLPTYEFTVTPTLTLFKDLRLSALVQRRGGNYVYNQTEEFRCTTSAFSNCRAVNDPTAPLQDQAAAIAYIKGQGASHWGFIQKGDFTKLREVSATYTLPKTVSGRMGMSTASFTLAGRNLHTWTPYRGFDPEVNYLQTASFSTVDFLTQVPFRQVVARMDVSF